MNNITQNMKFRQSLVSFVLKYGVSRTSGSTIIPALTSVSGYQGTMATLNHWPVGRESLIHTQISTPRKNLTFYAVCGVETLILVCVSSGAECASTDILAPSSACIGSCAALAYSQCPLLSPNTCPNHMNRYNIPASVCRLMSSLCPYPVLSAMPKDIVSISIRLLTSTLDCVI